MSAAIEQLQTVFQRAMVTRPQVGGFPHLAEHLRRAGVTRNVWTLPACQSLLVLAGRAVVMPGAPLATGPVDVAPFDSDGLIAALRTDQAGESSFPEFLDASWRAGVVSYDVDFAARTVSYFGAAGECYTESYPEAEVDVPA